MTFYEKLIEAGIDTEYYTIAKEEAKPPFVVYKGDGQDSFYADNIQYLTCNNYILEYYFTQKSSIKEKEFEKKLIKAGLNYTKSGDIKIESEEIYVIYYEVQDE